MVNLKYEFRKLLWKVGYDLSRFSPLSNPVARRKKLLQTYSIDVVLDVGANTGQFAKEIRKDLGFKGKIISFEPLSTEFKKLMQYSQKDANWEAINCALGDEETTTEINIAGNSYSSSLLNMLPNHSNAAPESKYISKEVIKIISLDSILDDYCKESDKIYLKIDTQGYENRVLKGAEKSLPRIGTIQLELSLAPLYEGGLLFEEMHSILISKGYSLVSLESEFEDPSSGRLLQLNGTYHRFQV